MKRKIIVRDDDKVLFAVGLGFMPLKEEGTETLDLSMVEFKDIFIMRRERSIFSNLMALWRALK